MNLGSGRALDHPIERTRSSRIWLLAAVVALMLAVAAAAGTSASAAPASATASSISTAQAAPLSCDALDDLVLPDVTRITAQLVTSGSSDGQSNLPAFCRVAIRVSPQVNIAVWLPTEATYNGRFQAVGGGGYAGSISFGGMAGALRSGYATASTDTGHSTPGGGFALNADGTLN